MRAVVYERYGDPDVLELREVEAPVAGEGEVLVRVRASPVTDTESHQLPPNCARVH